MTAARNLRTGGRRYCIWTDHEDALARNLEIPMAELAESLGRTANSIYRRRLILEVEGRHLDGRAARTKDPPLLGRPKRKYVPRVVECSSLRFADGCSARFATPAATADRWPPESGRQRARGEPDGPCPYPTPPEATRASWTLPGRLNGSLTPPACGSIM